MDKILEKWVSLGKMGHTWKDGSHLQKAVKHLRIGLSFKNRSPFEKCVTYEKWLTLGERPDFGKWVTIAKIGHARKN